VQLYPNMNAWMLLGKFFFCYKAWYVGQRGTAAPVRLPVATASPRVRVSA
jgi:hypothetical protein